ncbi:hypothetical protein, partial [Cryobacterium sp. MLB-32]|uniref:hypothetical protein n=1 Tax=Cryobacterium sp. MLB-32 TaxID=1529318 RepID=UPI001E5F7123
MSDVEKQPSIDIDTLLYLDPSPPELANGQLVSRCQFRRQYRYQLCPNRSCSQRCYLHGRHPWT